MCDISASHVVQASWLLYTYIERTIAPIPISKSIMYSEKDTGITAYSQTFSNESTQGERK